METNVTNTKMSLAKVSTDLRIEDEEIQDRFEEAVNIIGKQMELIEYLTKKDASNCPLIFDFRYAFIKMAHAFNPNLITTLLLSQMELLIATDMAKIAQEINE